MANEGRSSGIVVETETEPTASGVASGIVVATETEPNAQGIASGIIVATETAPTAQGIAGGFLVQTEHDPVPVFNALPWPTMFAGRRLSRPLHLIGRSIQLFGPRS